MFIKSTSQAIIEALKITNNSYDDNLIFKVFQSVRDVLPEDRDFVLRHLYQINSAEIYDYFQVNLWIKDIHGKGADTGFTGRHYITTLNYLATQKFLDNLRAIDPNTIIK